ELVTPGTDHEICDLEGADRRGADLVDRVGRYLLRDPGRYRGLPRWRLPDPGLQYLTHDHVLHLARLQTRARERLANRDRAELRRGVRGKAAAQATEGRSHGGDDHGAAHEASVPARTRPLAHSHSCASSWSTTTTRSPTT